MLCRAILKVSIDFNQKPKNVSVQVCIYTIQQRKEPAKKLKQVDPIQFDK